MAFTLRVLLTFCILVVYLTEPGVCEPLTVLEGRSPLPFLEKICSANSTGTLFRTHKILCFICKGFGHPCNIPTPTTTTTTTSTTTASPADSSTTTIPSTTSGSNPQTTTPSTQAPVTEDENS